MAIRRLSLAVVAAWLALAQQQTTSQQESLPARILKWSEAEQIAWIKSTLARGIPADLGSALGSLAANKASITMPLIEQKIEEVLRSPAPLDLFTDKSVDPRRFVALAASAIEYEGNEQSLREISKLLHLDEDRFDDAVQVALVNAGSFRNPFQVAYRGFEIGDPALDTRLAAWAEWELADKRPPLPAVYLAKRHYSYASTDPAPVPETTIQDSRQLWAEALVDRYGGVHSEAQWQRDPIASRLPAPMAQSLHDDMIRRTSEIMEKRVKR